MVGFWLFLLGCVAIFAVVIVVTIKYEFLADRKPIVCPRYISIYLNTEEDVDEEIMAATVEEHSDILLGKHEEGPPYYRYEEAGLTKVAQRGTEKYQEIFDAIMAYRRR